MLSVQEVKTLLFNRFNFDAQEEIRLSKEEHPDPREVIDRVKIQDRAPDYVAALYDTGQIDLQVAGEINVWIETSDFLAYVSR